LSRCASSPFPFGLANALSTPQPTHAYFGQKDIQQALLLRRMVSDLLIPHPTPECLHIVRTTRAPDGLALSSRNAYLSTAERTRAPVLYAALRAAADSWDAGAAKADCVTVAYHVLEDARRAGEADGVDARVDYIEFNDPASFAVLADGETRTRRGAAVVLSGAVLVGRTRLIDNIVLGDEGSIVEE
jgi:pantoate--beta-alanine ligase